MPTCSTRLRAHAAHAGSTPSSCAAPAHQPHHDMMQPPVDRFALPTTLEASVLAMAVAHTATALRRQLGTPDAERCTGSLPGAVCGEHGVHDGAPSRSSR